MKKVQANTRLDEDTAEVLEEHCDEQSTTKAEVLRRATRSYLSQHGHDVPATDGGKAIPQQKQIEQTQNQVEEVSAEVSSLSEKLDAILLPLVLAFLWIGIQTSVGFPYSPAGTAITGIPLLVWLAYVQLRGVFR